MMHIFACFHQTLGPWSDPYFCGTYWAQFSACMYERWNDFYQFASTASANFVALP